MKKQIISWGMMLAAAFALTNCAKEIEAPVQEPGASGFPFEISASVVDTKTVNDGMSTKWAENDKINVFHALAGGVEYVNDNDFTVSDVDAGRFTGKLFSALESGKEYDWYVLYPYASQITTPGEQTDGFTYIGHSKGLNQTGYDSMASLKGSVCPLYGTLKSCPASDVPSMDMAHISSVVAINVTNKNDEPLTITTASFTATEDIVGSYYIDITKTPVVCTPSGESYVKNTAVVNVSNGTALEKYESAVLYAAIKPFTATAGEKLTLSVNGYSKELTLTKDVTFTAGKIKTLKFAYDKAVEPEQTNVTWNLATTSYSSADANMVEWTSEFVTLSLEKSTSSTAANNYLGGVTTDNGTNAHTRVYKDQIMTFVPVGKNQIEKIEFVSTSKDYAQKLVDSDWTNADVTSSEAIVTATPNDGHSEVSVTIGAATRFTSIIVYYSYDEDYVPVPVITADASVSVAAAGGVAELSYSVKNPVEGKTVSASTTVDWISDFNYTTAGKVSFSVAENTGEARNGKVTLSYEGADSKEVTVTQAAGVTVAPTKVTVEEFTQLTGNEQTVYELSGVVSEIYQAYSKQYGNISFYIQDETGKVLIFRMTCDEEIGNAMRVGDEVTVQGRPTMYNEAIQMAQGCVCVAYTPAPYLELLSESASVAYDVITYSVTVNSNVEWTASASNGVTLDKTSGNGNATVSMTFVANDTQVDKTHTVTFIAGDKSKTFTLTQKTKPAPGDPTEFTDVLTRETTGVTGTSYKAWTYTSATTCAAYAGNSAGGNESIQLRSKDNAGIVTTTSGGYLKKVLVAWNDNTAEGRTLVVYGKNAAYSATSDLYDDSTSGTKLGEIVNGTTELVINGDYQYIGIRSKDGAMYLTNISITWSNEPGSGGNPEPSRSPRNLAFSSSTATATVGQPFTPPTLTGEKSGVTYTSSNANVATIDSSTGTVTLVGEGSTTITASAPETEQYEAGTANYTLTVSAAQQGGGESEKGAPYSYEITASTSKSNSWNKLMGGTNSSAINISGFSNKSITMGDLNWTVSASGASNIYFGGQQIGSSSNFISSFVLESDSYNGAVESITLTTCSNAGNTTIEVYVGGEQLGSKVTLPNSSTASDVTFSGDSLLEGKIHIKYTIPTTKKNIKITKISIN